MIIIKKNLEKQNEVPLFNALKEYHEKGTVPFDVPGHKKGKGACELSEFFGDTMLQCDVNSMKPLDNLSSPVSVIKEAQELMAEAYGADEAFFMVNGTTAAVQAMILSSCKPGDKIILPRNAHKSAVNGIVLSGANPIYVQPKIHNELGFAAAVEFEDIKRVIDDNKDAKAIFLVNPTYYGTVSQIDKIIEYAHKNGMIALVDEAHGAHFAFSDRLPKCAIDAEADLVAVSTHKTGGSLTQSSVLLRKGDRVKSWKVHKSINLTQTTSASYLLMSSLDVARRNLVLNGKQIFDKLIEVCRDIRSNINKIDGLNAFGREIIGKYGIVDFDELKLSINVHGLGLTGLEVYAILRDEYNIQVELGDMYNILAIVSVGDDENSLMKLYNALLDLASKYRTEKKEFIKINLQNPEIKISPRDAFYAEKVGIALNDACGKISGESVMVYPPGIPIICPGEIITEDIIYHINLLRGQNCMLNGIEDVSLNTIKIIE